MKVLNRRKFVYGSATLLGVVAFVTLSQWSLQYSSFLTELATQAGWVGVASYILVMAASIIFAPLGTGFLLPVAANTYGPLLTVVYSILGWTICSMISFWIARRLGSRIVKYQTFIDRMHYYEKAMPRYRFYVIVILFRMALPVDVISYVLGFASTISYFMFFVTTVIGITPLTLLFAYSATSTVIMQTTVSIIASVVFFVAMYFVYQEYLIQDKQSP